MWQSILDGILWLIGELATLAIDPLYAIIGPIMAMIHGLIALTGYVIPESLPAPLTHLMQCTATILDPFLPLESIKLAVIALILFELAVWWANMLLRLILYIIHLA